MTGPMSADSPDVRAWSLASGLGRVAIGISMLAAPELSMRLLGFREVSPATAAVSRLAGIRDLVLGVVTLTGMDDPTRLRAATLANAAADAGDTLAFAVALSSGERAAGARGLAAALPATLAGLWTASRLS
jgi:hypothetical protein